MSRHTITEMELDAWLSTEAWQIAASSAGKGSNKRLEVSTKGILRVTDHGTERYAGTDKAEAVAAYNDAR